MIETAVGTLNFSVGFKKNDKILFCGYEADIVIKAKAYFEEDGITEVQKSTIEKYKMNYQRVCDTITRLAEEYDNNAKSRFLPKTLLFGRKGECALLCDDKSAPDEGIAICIYPNEEILSQDDYL